MTWSPGPDPAIFVVHWAMMECGNGPLPRPLPLPFAVYICAQCPNGGRSNSTLPNTASPPLPLEYACPASRPNPIPIHQFCLFFFAGNWQWPLASRSFGWAHPFPHLLLFILYLLPRFWFETAGRESTNFSGMAPSDEINPPILLMALFRHWRRNMKIK
jgi:hypothetical protein